MVSQVPHTIFSNYEDAQECAELCQHDKTLLRYVDLEEATNFIMTATRICADRFRKDRMDIPAHFPQLDTVTMAGIKNYYVALILYVNSGEWACDY